MECNGSVYVLTLMDGLYECDGNGRIGRYFRLPLEYEKSAGAKELHLDSQGIIWVATQSGLLLLEPLTASSCCVPTSTIPTPAQQFGMVDLPRSRRRDMGRHIRRQTGLHDLRGQRRGLFQKPLRRSQPPDSVSCFEERHGSTLIGTGINLWDRRDGLWLIYYTESRCGLTSNMIKKLWHGNDRLLVSAFNGGMRVFDERQGRFSDLHMNHPLGTAFERL